MGKRIVIAPGDQYAGWTYLRDVEPLIYPAGRRKRMAEWRCECGAIKVVAMMTVRAGKSTSCGCRKALDLPEPGERFARLSFMREGEPRTSATGRWKQRTGVWLCDCGETPVITFNAVRSGKARSCGCLRRDEQSARTMTHGRTADYLHRTWNTMKQRCSNPKNSKYASYGGRGITVCQQWLDSFDQFASDMGERPSEKHSIDRIDVNGDYTPENAAWATPMEQARNKRRSGWWIVQGERFESMQDAADEHGVSIQTIANWCGRGKYADGREGCRWEPKHPDEHVA